MGWDGRTATEMVEDHRYRMAKAGTQEAIAEEMRRFGASGRAFALRCGTDPMSAWEEFAEIDANQAEQEEHGPDCGEREMRMIQEQEAAARLDPTNTPRECSICRGYHGREIIHVCE